VYGLKEVIISEDGTPVNVPTSLEPVDENYKGILLWKFDMNPWLITKELR
jgi:hypothetical protein